MSKSGFAQLLCGLKSADTRCNEYKLEYGNQPTATSTFRSLHIESK